MRRRGVRVFAAMVALAAVGLVGAPAQALGPQPQFASTAGEAPTMTPWPYVNGVGFDIFMTSSAYDGVRLYKRQPETEAWTVVGEKLRTAQMPMLLVDDELEPGASAEYAAQMTGTQWTPDGPLSPPLLHTRPADAPPAGTVSAFTMDTAHQSVFPNRIYDAGRGDALSVGDWHIKAATGHASGARVRVPRVPGPGTYVTGERTPYLLGASVDGAGCEGTYSNMVVRGTVVVQEAVYDAAGNPVVFTGSYLELKCPYHPAISGVLRWRSTHSYRAATTAPAEVRADARVGDTLEAGSVTVTNTGPEPLHTTAVRIATAYRYIDPEVALPGADDWAITGENCADRVLAPGATCRVDVSFTPSTTGRRAAFLEVDDDSVRGRRTVPLEGAGFVAPNPPDQPRVDAALGRVVVKWYATREQGDNPVAEYRVYRRVTGGQWQLRGTVTEPGPDGFRLADRAAPGRTYEWAVAAANVGGEGPLSQAQTATSVYYDVMYTVGQGTDPFRLEARAYSSGTLGALVPIAGAGRSSPAYSPDGRWIVYAQHSTAGTDLYKEPAGTDGTAIRLTSLSGDETDAAWSPDGKTIAFTHGSGAPSSVWTVPSGGGAATPAASGVADPSWLTDSRTVVATDTSSAAAGLVRVAVLGIGVGATTPIAQTQGGRAPAVSPDGTELAFIVERPGFAGSQLAVMPTDGSAPPLFTADSSSTIDRPAWAPNGTFGYVQRRATTAGAKWRVHRFGVFTESREPHIGSQQAWVPTSVDATEPVVRGLGVHLTDAPSLTGPNPTIGFGVAAPRPGTEVYCAIDGQQRERCASTWQGRRLTQGRHTLVLQADVVGLLEPSTLTAHTWDVDATPPATELRGPQRAVTLTRDVVIPYRATDSNGVASYDVRYRRAGVGTGFAPHVYPKAWQSTAAASRTLTLVPGHEYCVSARARDVVSNASNWTSERCTTAPLDDRALAASTGWRHVNNDGLHLATGTSTTRRGATLTYDNVSAKSVTLVATRCPDCGAVDVFIGATEIGRARLGSARTQRQALIPLPVQAAVRHGALTLRTATSGKRIEVDGVAVVRG